MKIHYVNLTDGSRLPVNINFGTLYYLQKSGAEAMLKRIGKRKKAGKGKMSEEESMEFAAKMIYVILRSNGKHSPISLPCPLPLPEPQWTYFYV